MFMNPFFLAMMKNWWMPLLPSPAVPTKPLQRDEPEH